MVSYNDSLGQAIKINPSKGMWHEIAVSYPYELRTDKYNIIREKNDVDLLIVPHHTSPRVMCEAVSPKVFADFNKFNGRKDKFPSLHQARFDPIEKNPKVGS